MGGPSGDLELDAWEWVAEGRPFPRGVLHLVDATLSRPVDSAAIAIRPSGDPGFGVATTAPAEQVLPSGNADVPNVSGWVRGVPAGS